MAKKNKTQPSPGTKLRKEKGPRIPIADVREVQDLVDIENEIKALKAENPEVFTLLADLVDRYNAQLEIAAKVVRARGVSCGPFENFSTVVKYDPEKMYEELGEDLFLKCGGTLSQTTVYDVDQKKVEAAIAGKLLPEESVEHFINVTHKYHEPKKVTT